ncbi:hypothetical protein GF406_11665 [candidate division KSB1 bacterium]|nr:hypothetical protein [candidate division KSB1 bacterium]
MKRFYFLTIIFLTIFHARAWSQSVKLEGLQLYEKDLVILGQDRKGPYFLPDSLIVKDSETVWIQQHRLTEDQYRLDYLKGEIRFQELVSDGHEIRIHYRIVPVQLEKHFALNKLFKRVPGAQTGTGEPVDPRRQEEEEIDYASQLNKSGSITRGISVGSNRGLKVNSSLNINVSGKVADKVEVLAALTDQNTPIQPEGTTQTLQEIDKVFVKINAPNMSATLGDYHLTLPESEFARYSRKLQGAMGEAHTQNWDVMVSGAVTRGKYLSQRIQGREGFQGPYQLKGERGQIDIIVLAGTERVYIDGQPMVRGESNDYIIDYAAAQITFTRRRLITSDSRIVVDFQYSDEKFKRNLYSARGESRLWDDRLKFSTTLLREADDKDNPLDFVLTDEVSDILSNAGDNPAAAFIDAAEFVGRGEGRYSRDSEGYFVFVGNDSGDYQVSFSDVGTGNGSYRYMGGGRYEYVGENQDRYAPVTLLSTAKSHSVVDFGLEFAPTSFLSVNGEMAISSFDQNTYSGLDDSDNSGLAQNWQIALTPDSMSLAGIPLGSLELTGRMRTIQNRFRDIDRSTQVEYNRRWDLSENLDRGENVQEWSLRYQPVHGWSVGSEYGKIAKGELFNSSRLSFFSQLIRPHLPQYRYQWEHIDKDDQNQQRLGDWTRQRGSAHSQIGLFKPFFEYEGEVKKENWADSLYTGFKFDDVSGGLEVGTGKRVSGSLSMSWRRDDDYTGFERFSRSSDALTQNILLQFQRLGAFSGTMAFTHRERSYADDQIPDKRTDLAEMRLNFTPWQRAVSGDVNYQISNTATAKKERIYIKVSQGDGNYRFDEDLKEYVVDPLGDYIMRILTTDEFIPTIELKSSARLRLDPSRFFSLDRNENKSESLFTNALKAISTESYVALEERSQEKSVWDIYLFDLQKFRQPGTTVFGNLHTRQDINLFEHDRDFSVRYRYQFRDELNNQYLEGGQDRLETEQTVRITARLFDQLGTRAELGQKQTRRTFANANRQDRDILAREGSLDLSFRPVQVLEFGLLSRFSIEQDRVYEEPTRVRAIAMTPRVSYAFRGKGRLSGEIEWSYVDAEPKGRLIPYEMASGRSLGSSMRWDFRFDYRISNTINATISYTGRNEPERDRTLHTARAQVTAAFR